MCSAALTTILTTSGKILTLGANAYGQCGVGRAGQDVWTPTQVLGLEHEVIVDMAPGLQHVVVCTEEGRVFAWGTFERLMFEYIFEYIFETQVEILYMKYE